MTWWFGDPWPRAEWRAPVCDDDARRVDTPVGATCLMCTEQIEDGDRGIIIGSVYMAPDGVPTAATAPVHAECNLRSVMGNHLHVGGECRHVGDCNERSTLSYREEARAVWRMLVLTDVGGA